MENLLAKIVDGIHEPSMIVQSFKSLVEYFVPDEIFEQDAETLRRARLVVTFSFALILWGGPFSLVYYYVLKSPEGGVSIAISVMIASIVPFLLKWTRSVLISGTT